MKCIRLLKRLPGDERAQAMTEFVIILPIVLLTFFVCVQTMLIAQASQLGSYAAFAAARSYATSYSKFESQTSSANAAHSKAETRARNAALLIMAPVSHAKLGEGLPIWRPMRRVMKMVGGRARRFYGLAEGYAVASMFRMKDFRVQKTSNSRTGTVKVSFDYHMPISVPGLAEIWNYLGRKSHSDEMDDFFAAASYSASSGFMVSVNDVLDGLAEMEKKTGLPIFGRMTDPISDVISDVNSAGYQGALYTIRIETKSMCGFEPWGHPGPGGLRSGERDMYCTADFDDDKQACVDAAEANDAAAQKEADECEEAHDATEVFKARSNDWRVARNKYLACITDPDADCDDEETAMDDAEVEKDDAHDFAEQQTDECEDAGKEAEKTLDKMEDECQ